MTNTLPKVTVVLPFFNAVNTLRRAAESILGQDFPYWECVMVDNNSSDGSAEVVRRHRRIKLLSEQRQGAYAARNRGLGEVQGAGRLIKPTLCKNGGHGFYQFVIEHSYTVCPVSYRNLVFIIN